MEIKICGRTDAGLIRKQNEDSFWYDEELQTAVVADGLGGEAAGEVASAVAVRAFEEVIRSTLSRAGLPDDIRHIMASAIGFANREILAEPERGRGRPGMLTTMVCVCIRWNRCVVAHVGDSRTYLIRERDIIPLTRDHSYVMELLERGVITPEEAAVHPYRNLVTRVVGGESGAEADFATLDIQEGDRFLLCSDGLTNVLEDDEILDAIR
ncbi:MAG: protein phosphatase 2C domain-containing protein, partial [Candidatus Latescibacterota bacterium]